MRFAPSVTRRLIEAYAPTATTATAPPPLAARETDVLRLVGTECSNVDIAAELYVSEAP